jgi:aryl-alcohol dehydrogenase-like predicted oxidoreductase
MKIILGTANFLNYYGIEKKLIGSKKVLKILNYCKKNRIINIDTAESYNNFFKLRLNFNKFKINTKIIFDISKIKNKKYLAFLKSKIKKNIKKKNINQYNSILIHNFYEIKKKNDFKIINQFLIDIKQEGLAKYTGASLYDIKEINYIKFFDTIDILQFPLNFLNRSFDKKTLINLKKKGIFLYARSVFLQGLLLKNTKELNKKLSREKIFQNLDKWYIKNPISRLEACLGYIKSFKNIIDGFIIGIDDFSQIIEIIKIWKSKKINFPYKIYSNKKKIIDPRKWN